MRSTIFIAFCVGLLFFLSPSAQADTSPPVPHEAIQYNVHIERIIHSSKNVTLEPVFKEGLSAATKVQKLLEDFDEHTFKKIEATMTGFVLNREEVLIATPDVNFFLALAQKKGTGSDKAFFDALKKTYPDSVWPDYIEQQSDAGGCVKFGGGVLKNLYGTWLAFQKKFPNQYSQDSAHELHIIEDALESTCVCKDKNSVQNEMKSLAETYPNSPIAAKAQERLEMIKSNKVDIRAYCVAG